jgi:hypothetical protein
MVSLAPSALPHPGDHDVAGPSHVLVPLRVPEAGLGTRFLPLLAGGA